MHEDDRDDAGRRDDADLEALEEERDNSAEPEEPGSARLTSTGYPLPTPYPRSRPPANDEPVDWTPIPAPRRRSKLRTTGKVLLALLSVVALVATGYAYATYDNLQNNMHTTDALTPDDDKQAPPEDDGADDILLVGTDARTDMQGNPLPLQVLKDLRTEDKVGINTDTLIILRMPRNGGKPAAVSLPRDTWVNVPQGGQAKINSAYWAAKVPAAEQLRASGVTDNAEIERDSDQAGRKALVKTIQDLTQIRIDHFAEVNLLGFYLLTEALGGVEVCLKHATEDKDSGANFRAGHQVVSGGEALSFVRQRKNLPRGDLDRIVRQQAFLASALHKVLSAGTLTNPSMLNQLTDAIHRSVVLDPGTDILRFAEQAKGIASGDIEFKTIPVLTLAGRSPDGQQSIVEVDQAAVRKYVRDLVTPNGSAAPPPAGGGGGAAAGGFGATSEVATDGVSCVN